MNSALQRLIWRVRHLLVRGSVATHSDVGRMQTTQVNLHKDELLDGVEVLLPYGFTMRVQPEPSDGQGAETLVLAIGTDHRVALPPSDRRYRPRGAALKVGDSALYTDLDAPEANAGRARHRIHLTRGESGDPEIHARSGPTSIRMIGSDTPEVDIRCGTSAVTMTDTRVTLAADEVRIVSPDIQHNS